MNFPTLILSSALGLAICPLALAGGGKTKSGGADDGQPGEGATQAAIAIVNAINAVRSPDTPALVSPSPSEVAQGMGANHSLRYNLPPEKTAKEVTTDSTIVKTYRAVKDAHAQSAVRQEAAGVESVDRRSDIPRDQNMQYLADQIRSFGNEQAVKTNPALATTTKTDDPSTWISAANVNATRLEGERQRERERQERAMREERQRANQARTTRSESVQYDSCNCGAH